MQIHRSPLFTPKATCCAVVVPAFVAGIFSNGNGSDLLALCYPTPQGRRAVSPGFGHPGRGRRAPHPRGAALSTQRGAPNNGELATPLPVGLAFFYNPSLTIFISFLFDWLVF